MLHKGAIMNMIPQIIGLLAVATFLFSYQQKKRKNIILFNTISRCLYILGKAICDDCEWRIIKAKAHEESYSKYSNALKTLICQKS